MIQSSHAPIHSLPTLFGDISHQSNIYIYNKKNPNGLGVWVLSVMPIHSMNQCLFIAFIYSL